MSAPRGPYLHKNGNDVTEIKLGWLAKTLVSALFAMLAGMIGLIVPVVVSDHFATIQNAEDIAEVKATMAERVKWGEAEHRDIRNEQKLYELKEDHRRDVDALRRIR